MATKVKLYDRFANASPEKLLKQRKRRGGFSLRDYTYRIEIGCDPGTSYFTYVLRGDAGAYSEDACGAILPGTLAYVTDVTITFEEFELSGHVYNGRDELGDWGYFFGTDDLSGEGHYLVMLDAPYQTGDPPPWDPNYGAIATRTQP